MTADLRRAVVETAQEMSRRGLSPHKSGNVSVRDGQSIYITPSGLSYETMQPADIVEVAIDGSAARGQRKPSSETPMHLEIYLAHPAAGAIVHCHSMAATTLSCLRKPIPAFHYMVAITGGGEIACAAYATFGTDELAKNAVAALETSSACLLANHGQIAFGATLEEALATADQVELLARMYLDCLSAGEPHVLDAREMQRVLAKFETYGK
jgi:L-fuculose-phosphate aldolase